MTELDAMAPQQSPEDQSEMDEGIIDRSFAAFKAKMEAVIEATKNKNKKQRERKKHQRIEHKAALFDALKRAQRYLGLSETELGSFDHDVVFVALDIEVWERNHRTVTEIGITSLDTRDIHLLDPGEDGNAWMDMLRPRHFRIREASHIVNSEFVRGCADRFQKQFGESEWISRHEATSVVASCLRPPFSASFSLSRSSNFPISYDDKDTEAARASGERRNVVLVGHDIQSDVEYLRDMGYDLASVPHIIEALDTAKLFKALKQEWQAANLGSVLLDLGLTGWNLHNAGNDAAYTMQCLLLIALKASRTSVYDRPASADASRANDLELAAEEAKAQILADGDEWKAAAVTHERTGNDGGKPVPLLPRQATKKSIKAEQRQKRQQEEEKESERKAEGFSAQVEVLSNLDVEAMEKLAEMRSAGGIHGSEGKTLEKEQGMVDKVSARLERRLKHLESVQW